MHFSSSSVLSTFDHIRGPVPVPVRGAADPGIRNKPPAAQLPPHPDRQFFSQPPFDTEEAEVANIRPPPRTQSRIRNSQRPSIHRQQPATETPFDFDDIDFPDDLPIGWTPHQRR